MVEDIGNLPDIHNPGDTVGAGFNSVVAFHGKSDPKSEIALDESFFFQVNRDGADGCRAATLTDANFSS